MWEPNGNGKPCHWESMVPLDLRDFHNLRGKAIVMDDEMENLSMAAKSVGSIFD
jgi:hypothetical protein